MCGPAPRSPTAVRKRFCIARFKTIKTTSKKKFSYVEPVSESEASVASNHTDTVEPKPYGKNKGEK